MHHPLHSVVLVYLVLVAVLSVLLLLLMAWQALVGRLRQIPAHGNPAPSPTDQGTEEGGDQAADIEHRRREGPDPQVQRTGDELGPGPRRRRRVLPPTAGSGDPWRQPQP